MEDKRFQNPKISFLEQNNCIDFAIRLMAKEIAKSIVADEKEREKAQENSVLTEYVDTN